MSDGLIWIALAWVLFGLSVWAVATRRRRNGSRHFPYGPRAELLQQALEKKLPVKFVYWSQAEERWLRRKVTPVDLGSGHLRGAERSTGHSRRYEVTRMRQVTVGGRTVRPPLRWQVPLAVLMGLVAGGASGLALWQRVEVQKVGATNAVPVHWLRDLNAAPVMPLETVPAAGTNVEAALASMESAEPAIVDPEQPLWGVVVEDDATNAFNSVVTAFQQVFLFARPQAIHEVRRIELDKRHTVWRGSERLATNYVAELQKRGIKSTAVRER